MSQEYRFELERIFQKGLINDSSEVAIDLVPGGPKAFTLLRREAADLVERLLAPTRDNRLRFIRWGWRAEWIRRIGVRHQYIVKVAVIAAYFSHHDCLNPGDFLYLPEASSKAKTLRFPEPIKPLVVAAFREPENFRFKYRTFERKQIRIFWWRGSESFVKHSVVLWERVN